MAQNSSFKEYSRQRRQATIDTNFSLGMYYTDGPIEEGYVKTLINYDLASNKQSLITRPGLRVGELITSYSSASSDLTGFFSKDVEIYDAKDCIENGIEYRQIILGNPKLDKIWVLTVAEGLTKETTLVYPEPLLDYDDDMDIDELYTKSIEAIRNYEMNTEYYESRPSFDEFSIDLSISFEDPFLSKSCVFNSVLLNKIHDIVIDSDTVHYSIVGTFGFNNNYYFLSKEPNGSALCRTFFNPNTNEYSFEDVESKTITASEAVTFGYNMLDSNPYTFEDGHGASTVFQLQGILPYDDRRANNGKLMMTPKKNQDVWFRCNYNVPSLDSKYKVVWDWKELNSDTWILLDESEVTFNDLPVLEVPFKAPSDNIMVRVQVYKWGTWEVTQDGITTTLSDYDTVVEKAMTVGFDFTIDEHGTVNNLKQENYDLSHASGMYYWKNRLVLFGVTEDPTILFISDLNEPSYFPYPNNITVFDQPIVSVIELMDDLIVFTTDKIYQVRLSDDGNSWITTIVQSNLRIDAADRHLILTVRNMLFFKSGDHYYMVVPKASSTTGELTLAPISTTIKELFNTFTNSFVEFLDALFSYNDSFRLIDYYNFLDYEDVHNVYVFRMKDEDEDEDKYGYFHYDLIYNTVDRTWRIYTYQTAHKIFPYQYDSSRSGVFAFTDVYEKSEGVYARNIQLLKFDPLNCKDFYIPSKNVADVAVEPITGLRKLILKESDQYFFKNYQYLDTGYRNDNYHRNKRYREMQFQINNLDCNKLSFGMDFLLDGDSRMTFLYYNIEQVIDEDNARYGLIYIEPTPVMNIPIDELNIIPDDIAFRANHWSLDESLFPEVNLWKIRTSVTGKGMAPRVRLVSYNESRFELSRINWVYRMMYMR